MGQADDGGGAGRGMTFPIGSPHRVHVHFGGQPFFEVGQNCSALELTPHGVLVRKPMVYRGDGYKLFAHSKDLLVSPSGLVTECNPPEPEDKHRTHPVYCPACDRSFKNTQALNGHMRFMHKEMASR